jgi:hypothetical protein
MPECKEIVAARVEISPPGDSAGIVADLAAPAAPVDLAALVADSAVQVAVAGGSAAEAAVAAVGVSGWTLRRDEVLRRQS